LDAVLERLQNGATYDPWLAYAQSKTATMLFSRSLARKLGDKGVTSFSVHPGVVFTNLCKHVAIETMAELGNLDRVQGHAQYWDTGFAAKPPSQGVATHVFAAFSPLLDRCGFNGSHLADSAMIDDEDVNSWARDHFDAERLWKLSETLTGHRTAY
jgi:NAD(P)-dependent dehydrogenase (short-subunit alcohol dehydrogenase family)